MSLLQESHDRPAPPRAVAPSSGLLQRFPADADTPTTAVDQLGGKGASLVWMAAQGHAVPPGIVVLASFFRPWFEHIRQTAEWSQLCAAPIDQWPARCAGIQADARRLPLDDAQQRALAELCDALPPDARAGFAVRSSSPDEDLAGASFAGAYVTRLGVRSDALEPAIRDCFVSALDARVLLYKRQRGLDPFTPRIAVVVQQQIDSEVAGIGFSLNPLNNDYDEAVVEASFGQGEAIVAGQVEPDQWVVGKLDRAVIVETIGAKQLAVRLDPLGGTQRQSSERSDRPSLAPAQLVAVVGELFALEQAFGHPVDIEWAWADGQLHILQARPITTWVPLPDDLRTAPGERRRLYLDAALSKGFAMNQPISALGVDASLRIFAAMGRAFLGRWPERMGPDDGYVRGAGGRLYADLSNVFWLASPAQMATSLELSDSLAARAMRDIDATVYRSPRRPRWARPAALLQLPAVLWRLRPMLWTAVAALVAPDRVGRGNARRKQAFDALIDEVGASTLPLPALLARYAAPFVECWTRASIMVVSPALIAQRLIERLCGGRDPERQRLAQRLAHGHDGNVVIDMNIAMARVATQLRAAGIDAGDAASRADAARRLQQRDLPTAVLRAWDAFMHRHGCRGPGEVDIAVPRYADDPQLLLRQVAAIDASRAHFDPADAHGRQQRLRHDAVAALSQRLGPLRRALLRHLQRVCEAFAGERDTPKLELLRFLQQLRRRALQAGARLTEQGLLDAEDDVFHLRVDEIAAALAGGTIDLRAVRDRRSAATAALAAGVRNFPSLIDSRGRIPRPRPGPLDASMLAGTAISAGVVSGPVKVLQTADDKPVEPGDILVAYTTDPGWTPLFANAAAIVLEVGGSLQHGAVVAREFGKPCVAGIDRVTSRLRDGQRVEVDGGAGTVRLLDA